MVIRAEKILLYLLRSLRQKLPEIRRFDTGGRQPRQNLVGVFVAVIGFSRNKQLAAKIHLRRQLHIQELRAKRLCELRKLRYARRRSRLIHALRIKIRQHAVFKAHYQVADIAPR